MRYLQCTDWAPQEERGVHDSVILFNPDNPSVRLRDSSVKWTQVVRPTFIGEREPGFWKDDGDRYRAYPEMGGTIIVRLRFLKELIEAAEPFFYK